VTEEEQRPEVKAGGFPAFWFELTCPSKLYEREWEVSQGLVAQSAAKCVAERLISRGY